jgi:hypothetical protein
LVAVGEAAAQGAAVAAVPLVVHDAHLRVQRGELVGDLAVSRQRCRR